MAQIDNLTPPPDPPPSEVLAPPLWPPEVLDDPAHDEKLVLAGVEQQTGS